MVRKKSQFSDLRPRSALSHREPTNDDLDKYLKQTERGRSGKIAATNLRPLESSESIKSPTKGAKTAPGEEFSYAIDRSTGVDSRWSVNSQPSLKLIQKTLDELFSDAGVPLTTLARAQLSNTALRAAIITLINEPGQLRDPVSGLLLPPQPRKVKFQDRGKTPAGRRMTYDEYLADRETGWGEYTQNALLGSFWILEYDKALYNALLYRANAEADESGVASQGNERAAAVDEFFLALGILTPNHLENPPAGREWQARLLAFVRKQQYSAPKGRTKRSEGR